MNDVMHKPKVSKYSLNSTLYSIDGRNAFDYLKEKQYLGSYSEDFKAQLLETLRTTPAAEWDDWVKNKLPNTAVPGYWTPLVKSSIIEDC